MKTEAATGQEKRLSIDDLLQQQERSASAVTIEPVDGDSKKVKITPWSPGGGCQCHLAIEIPKEAVSHVIPTGQKHYCCGKVLQVVEAHFASDGSIALPDLMKQLGDRAHHHDSTASIPWHAQEHTFEHNYFVAPMSRGGYCLGRMEDCFATCDPSIDDCYCKCRNVYAACMGRPVKRCLPHS
jgi:hypothetical protein